MRNFVVAASALVLAIVAGVSTANAAGGCKQLACGNGGTKKVCCPGIAPGGNPDYPLALCGFVNPLVSGCVALDDDPVNLGAGLCVADAILPAPLADGIGIRLRVPMMSTLFPQPRHNPFPADPPGSNPCSNVSVDACLACGCAIEGPCIEPPQ